MQRSICILTAVAICWAFRVHADYAVENRGAWPNDWPAELEPLRERSRTLEGPRQPLLHYAIPFTKREEFEAAWPQILKVKSKGAPIILRRGPSFWLGKESIAGVCIHTPPRGEVPISGELVKGGRWEQTNYVELMVDGQIVDLNRIPLPADTPIIDERFKDGTTSPSAQGGRRR
jgi:hypothetical protein